MASELKPPIILFGNTRSGTTIVQQLISRHPDVVGWYEPRTLWLYADPRRTHDEFDEDDATPKVVRYIRRRFMRFQQRHGDRLVMEKTPANILKIPYVHAILPEATYLFIVRDPFSFVSSVEMKFQRAISATGIRRRLRSTPVSQLHHYAGRLVRDHVGKRILHRKYLSTWGPRYKGMERDLTTNDLLTVIARQWAKCSRKAAEDLSRFDQEVLAFKYEDFVQDPISHLERITSRCGLQMTKHMVTAANERVESDRQLKWHRLRMHDLARVLPELRDEMERHGYRIPEEISRAASGDTSFAGQSRDAQLPPHPDGLRRSQVDGVGFGHSPG
jgi:hypothetical protein